MGDRRIYKAPYDDERTRLRPLRKHHTICRWCGGPLSGRRTSWCSEDCWATYFIQINPRVYVSRRDNGVCARCKLDTRLLKRVLLLASRSLRDTESPVRMWSWSAVLKDWLGMPRGRSFWDADHIVPLSQGGDHHPRNLQTLCVPCHKLKSAEDAARAAKRRRA